MSKSGIPVVSDFANFVTAPAELTNQAVDAISDITTTNPNASMAPPSPTSDEPLVAADTNNALDQAAKTESTTARSRAATILTTRRGLLGGPGTARRTLLGA